MWVWWEWEQLPQWWMCWFKVVSENNQLDAAVTDVVFTRVAPEGNLKRRTLEIKNRFTT